MGLSIYQKRMREFSTLNMDQINEHLDHSFDCKTCTPDTIVGEKSGDCQIAKDIDKRSYLALREFFEEDIDESSTLTPAEIKRRGYDTDRQRN